MNTNQDHNASLPIRRNLGLTYALSFITAILMAAASVAGLLYRNVITRRTICSVHSCPMTWSIFFIDRAIPLVRLVPIGSGEGAPP